jgi:pimeloyl-ACP methyl ester carboxylesterase
MALDRARVISTAALTHHTVLIKDIRVHYVTAGSGDPVVLLHGWPQTGAAWDRVSRSLAEQFTVIVPDLRGMGYSTKAATGYDMNNIADDVHELVHTLGHDQICLAGHDWGAAAAYSYAAQFRGEVKRLAIFEMLPPGFGPLEEAMVPKPGGRFLWHMGFQSVPAMPAALIAGREDIYLNWIFQEHSYDPDAVRPEVMRPYVEAMRGVGALEAGLRYYADYFVTAAQNAEHAKHKLDLPVLAFGGDASLADLPSRCMKQAADDVSGGIIERCGHWVSQERPDFVSEQLLEFFGTA